MRIRTLLITGALVIGLVSSVQAASPKPGAKCTKAGKTSLKDGIEYRCIKKSGKLVWNNGARKVLAPAPTIAPSPTASQSTAPTPTPTAEPTKIPEEPIKVTAEVGARCPSENQKQTIKDRTYSCLQEGSMLRWKETARNFDFTYSTDDGYLHEYLNPCQFESSTPDSWKLFQNYYYSFSRCSGQFQLRRYQLGSERPTVDLSAKQAMQSIEMCRILEPDSSRNLRGFINKNDEGRTRWFNNSKFPAPGKTIQVVPFIAKDSAPSNKSPTEDYKIFFDYVKNWIDYATDFPIESQIRVHPTYIKVDFSLGQYKINHERHHSDPNHQGFRTEIMKVADPLIDFSKADHVLFLTTPGTPIEMFQQGAIGSFQTNEKFIWTSSTQFPYTLANPASIKFANLAHPFWWIHEFYHAGVGLDDHYGDQKRDLNTEYGMGSWTLMTPWGGDLSAWEKWFLGFIGDEQVNCAPTDKSSTHWLTPSSVKSTSNKLFVLPLGKHKAIVAESIRPAGLYYKISRESTGVLLYVVDLEVVGHGLGMKLVLPTNRNPNPRPNDFFLAEAPLRKGETVVTNGFRISVLESGNFGDVIQVEPTK